MIRPKLIGWAVLAGIIGGLLLDTWIVEAGKPVTYQAEPEPPVEILIGVKIDWTPERIKQEVLEKSNEYHVSFDQMWNTMLCENPKLDPTLQSYHVKNGVREDSWGLAQIHLPSHPSISKKEATDPAFAIDFMAKGFASGDEWMWSCWRQLYQ